MRHRACNFWQNFKYHRVYRFCLLEEKLSSPSFIRRLAYLCRDKLLPHSLASLLKLSAHEMKTIGKILETKDKLNSITEIKKSLFLHGHFVTETLLIDQNKDLYLLIFRLIKTPIFPLK